MPAEYADLPPNVASQLMVHAMNGAQRQADGAAAYAENLRYDYLEGKNGVSSSEAVGERRMDESGAGRARETAAGAPANR